MGKTYRNLSATLAGAALLFVAGCDSGKRVAGGGSDIGNGSAVSGLALTTDGIPSRGALARLRPIGYLAPLPAGAPKAAAGDSLGETRSDAHGRFAFAHILPGRYRIELADSAHGQGALIDCRVDSGGKDVELAETRLAATGTLSIHAPAGAAAGAFGYVRMAGLERLARLGAGDSLRMEGIPAGDYVVDIFSKDTAMARLSGTAVSLRPGEATLFDSTGQPCGDRACDTLALAAFLQANHLDADQSKYTQDAGRILNLKFAALPAGFRFAAMQGLNRLSALATFKIEGPYLPDSQIGPLMGALAGKDSLWLLSLSWSLDSGFTAIPASIGKLANLRELYLLGDSLRTLPGEIGNLAKLEFISLQFNRLGELPDWGGLTRLRELQVPHNLLKVLPESVYAWPALEKIDIADNHLCSFTAGQKTWLEARNAYTGADGQTCP